VYFDDHVGDLDPVPAAKSGSLWPVGQMTHFPRRVSVHGAGRWDAWLAERREPSLARLPAEYPTQDTALDPEVNSAVEHSPDHVRLVTDKGVGRQTTVVIRPGWPTERLPDPGGLSPVDVAADSDNREDNRREACGHCSDQQSAEDYPYDDLAVNEGLPHHVREADGGPQ
jgi:hypothetical protein